jgi:hypothetical protein
MIKTEPLYTLEESNIPELSRFVDRQGNWNYYVHKEHGLLPSVTYITDIGINKGVGFVQYLLSVSKEESRKLLEETGERGSRTHRAITNLLEGELVELGQMFHNRHTGKNEPLDEIEWQNLLAFDQWVRDFAPNTYFSEVAVYYTWRTRLAGTLDWYGTINVPEKTAYLTVKGGQIVKEKFKKDTRIKVLLDWKTTSGIYKSHYVQVSAYFKALTKMIKDKEYKAPTPVFAGVVRLGTRHKSGYEMVLFDKKAVNYYYDRFLSAYKLVDDELLSEQPAIETIPVQIQVDIPKL